MSKQIYRENKKLREKTLEQDQGKSLEEDVRKIVNQQRSLRRRKDNEISHLKVKIAGLIPKHNSTIVNDDIEIDSVTIDNDNNEGNDFVGETT